MNNFTFEETNLLCIYNTGSRTGLIEALTEMCGELSPEETELQELTDSALGKLQGAFAGGNRTAGADRQRPGQAPGHERRRVCRAGIIPGF